MRPTSLKAFLFFALLGLGGREARAGNLGSFPDFKLLREADMVAPVDPATIGEVSQQQGFDLSAYQTNEVAVAKVLKGEAGKSVKYIADWVPVPKAAKAVFLYLKKGGGGVFAPVSRRSTVIPTSLPMNEVRSMVDHTEWTEAGETAVLAKVFAKETEGECALAQAMALVTAPGPLPSDLWPSIVRVNDGSKLELAQILVGLHAVGPAALSFPGGVADLAKATAEPETGYSRANLAEGYLCGWFRKQGRDLGEVGSLWPFVLAQQGEFQGRLLIEMERGFAKEQIPPVAELMVKSENTMVQYACFKIISSTLNDGKGIIGYDTFRKKKQKYLSLAGELAKKAGDAR